MSSYYQKGPPSRRRRSSSQSERGGSRREMYERERLHESRRTIYDPQPAPCFDINDRAPEDRYQPNCHAAMGKGQQSSITDGFGMYDPVVRGTLHVDGVNYSRYEACKDKPERVGGFLDALKDDLISEVGNGVRREDIRLRVYPGAIKTVVLHYDDESPVRESSRTLRQAVGDPRLVDAEWSLKVDYGIRAKDPQRQHNVAVALFSALTSPHGFADGKTQGAYRRFIDPTTADVGKIVITRPLDDNTTAAPAVQPADTYCQPPPAWQNSTPNTTYPQSHQPPPGPSPIAPAPLDYSQRFQSYQGNHQSAQYSVSTAAPQYSSRTAPGYANGQCVPVHCYPNPGPGSPSVYNAGTPYDVQRDLELARLSDEIHRERMKLRYEQPRLPPTTTTTAKPPMVSSPHPPDRPSHFAESAYSARRTTGTPTPLPTRKPIPSITSVASRRSNYDPHYVTTEF
ncbi:hypothetical protein DIPPA_33165 [Diplonema papillatum]|nr:hypothetical protein DIPPA_33165 [Diplonema papillatum]